MFDIGDEYVAECSDWFIDQVENLTDTMQVLEPSEWAEQKRYIPRGQGPFPGPYRFENRTPFWKEPLDCLSPRSPIQFVSIKKGVQTGATVGVLENIIGYYAEHVKYMPIAMVTADDGLAKFRMENHIQKMFSQSGLEHIIKSSDESSNRKSGMTAKKMEWIGGGFVMPLTAQSPRKARSATFPIMLKDEVDGWPRRLGKDGNPYKLYDDRTVAYEESGRKILNISTPLITQTSNIDRGYEDGDKRKWMVPCKHCGKKQELVFNGTNEDGTIFGLFYELTEEGKLVEDTVRYLCKYCQGEHVNDDKIFMLNNGDWVPTAKPITPFHRSYHLPSLYSPVGMRTWNSLVSDWLECWDVVNNIPRDMDLLQQFYNNVLAKSFEIQGEALRFERVALHRRSFYHSGEIPNKDALKSSNSIVHVLTCAVDVHKKHLDVEVMGWCTHGTFYSIDWLIFETADNEDIDDLQSSPWQKLRDLLEKKVYIADDGKQYRVQLTLVDSGYKQDTVMAFCSEYGQGVLPIVGRELPAKNAAFKYFWQTETKTGQRLFCVTNTLYKDRMSGALRREWDGIRLQTPGHPNFPRDYPDEFFKQLTAESKQEKINATTGASMGFFWHCPANAPNHAWDLTVYNAAALDMIAFDTCQHVLRLETPDGKPYLDWAQFWAYVEKNKPFFL